MQTNGTRIPRWFTSDSHKGLACDESLWYHGGLLPSHSGTNSIHCVERDPQGTISNPQNKYKKQILSTWIDHYAIGSAYQQVIDHHKSESGPRLLIPQFPFPIQLMFSWHPLRLYCKYSLLRLGDGSTLDIIYSGIPAYTSSCHIIFSLICVAWLNHNRQCRARLHMQFI